MPGVPAIQASILIRKLTGASRAPATKSFDLSGRRISDRSSIGRDADPHADVPGLVFDGEPSIAGGAAALRDRDPTAALGDMVIARFFRAGAAAPFPDVALHVIEAPLVGQFHSHGM